MYCDTPVVSPKFSNQRFRNTVYLSLPELCLLYYMTLTIHIRTLSIEAET
jgi:hypothetical protein